jgi:hypothetical protein
VDGTLRKEARVDAFGVFSYGVQKLVRDLLVTLRTEGNPHAISQLILEAYVTKHAKPLDDDENDEGRVLGLESGNESGLDN